MKSRQIMKIEEKDSLVFCHILKILNLLGGCKYKIYKLSYSKFCIYTHQVKSKVLNDPTGFWRTYTVNHMEIKQSSTQKYERNSFKYFLREIIQAYDLCVCKRFVFLFNYNKNCFWNGACHPKEITKTSTWFRWQNERSFYEKFH